MVMFCFIYYFHRSVVQVMLPVSLLVMLPGVLHRRRRDPGPRTGDGGRAVR